MTSHLKNTNIFLLTAIILCSFCSCGEKKQKANQLLGTIEPQKYFLEQLVGDKFQISTLVPKGANPESFDPSPSQMMVLNNSKAYFKIGFFGVENTLIEKIKDESELNIVDCSNGIDIIDGCDHDHIHQ